MRSASAQTASEGYTASINGMEMYYEVHGEGPPLVLLHYFTGTSQSWEPFTSDLAKEYQLIIPDLRGHGRSTNPTGAFTHRQSALDIFALLDHLEIEQFAAMGMSSGADVLLHMATQRPARVKAMVLIGSTSYITEQERAVERKNKYEDWNWNDLRQRHVHGDDQIRALLDQFRGFAVSYDDINFTPPYLSTIAAQTLIVHGDRDWSCPVSLAAEMYSSIPHAYLWIVPNGGHLPVYGIGAAAFTHNALEFLRGAWEAT